MVVEKKTVLIGKKGDVVSELDVWQGKKKSVKAYISKDIYKTIGIEFKNKDLNELNMYLNNQKKHKMNTYTIERSILEKLYKEFKFSFKKMNYNIPSNLNIIN